MGARRLPPALLALSCGEARPREVHQAVAAAVARGLRGVLLREPALGDRDFLELACALRALLALDEGGWLCLHDRPHLVAACGADAVHLGGRSLAAEHVRPWLGEGIALGLSTHEGDDPAGWACADYIVHGPVGEVSKTHARAPIGSAGIARAAAASRVPVWALGGVRPEDAAGLRAQGAAGVAVMSRLLGAPDPGAAAAAWLAALAPRAP